MMEAVLSAERIYVAGQGRSGLVSRAFAMRLMHLGLRTYVVGDVTTPAIGPGDLLVACSRSGETASTCHIASSARGAGASVCAITTRESSRLSEIADFTIPIPEPPSSIQPGGTLFEQCLLVFLDGIILLLKGKLGESEEDMLSRHSNME
ncbi:MAG: 6-phospho-3-hexuloisomerase [bacterium]